MAFNEKYVTVAGGGLHDGSSEANAWTLAEGHANCAAGDRINVKAGTYTLTSALYTSKSGTEALPLAWRGYKTTIGDRDNETTRQVAGTDIPKIVTNSNSGYFGFLGNYIKMSRMAFESNTFYRPALYYRWGSGCVFHCQFLSTGGHSGGAIVVSNGSRQILAFCEVEDTHSTVTASGINIGNHCQIIGNTFRVASPTATCISAASHYVNIINNLCIGGGASCVMSGNSGVQRNVTNNTFVGSSTGLSISGSNIFIANNLFANTTNGISAAADCENLIHSNAFYNTTTEYTSTINPNTGIFNSVTETADPFVDAANNDYALKADALSAGAASPAKIPLFFTQNNADIGALQHADPSGNFSPFHPLGS
jgi:hypothetical protein